jgi:hypothetical protein
MSWLVDPAVYYRWPAEPTPPPMGESDSENDCPCGDDESDCDLDLDTAPAWEPERTAFTRDWTCLGCHATGKAVYTLRGWRDEDTPIPGTYVRVLPAEFAHVETSGEGEVWAWPDDSTVCADFRFDHHE